jgi:hypothetical protein
MGEGIDLSSTVYMDKKNEVRDDFFFLSLTNSIQAEQAMVLHG